MCLHSLLVIRVVNMFDSVFPTMLRAEGSKYLTKVMVFAYVARGWGDSLTHSFRCVKPLLYLQKCKKGRLYFFFLHSLQTTLNQVLTENQFT